MQVDYYPVRKLTGLVSSCVQAVVSIVTLWFFYPISFYLLGAGHVTQALGHAKCALGPMSQPLAALNISFKSAFCLCTHFRPIISEAGSLPSTALASHRIMVLR